MQDKQKYEEALKTVKKFEKRQANLKMLNKELGFLLDKEFTQFKFNMNKKRGTLRFAGVLNNGELVMTESSTKKLDVFEPVIGKLICVHKALDKDFSFLEGHIERKYSDLDIDLISDGEVRVTKNPLHNHKYKPIQATSFIAADLVIKADRIVK